MPYLGMWYKFPFYKGGLLLIIVKDSFKGLLKMEINTVTFSFLLCVLVNTIPNASLLNEWKYWWLKNQQFSA